jgi:ABC-type transport system involved in Fe-S cluster assembly fused permease/ATPase subunit
MSEEEDSSSGGMSSWLMASCFAAVTFQLFRLSIDLIQTASQSTSKDFKEDHHNATKDKTGGSSSNVSATVSATVSKKKPFLGGVQQLIPKPSESSNYGSVATSSSSVAGSDITNGDNNYNNNEGGESEQLLPLGLATTTTTSPPIHSIWSWRIQAAFSILFLLEATIGGTRFPALVVLPTSLVWCAFCVVALGACMTRGDLKRIRFGIFARLFSLVASVLLYVPCAVLYYNHRTITSLGDEVVSNAIALYGLLSLAEVIFVTKGGAVDTTASSSSSGDEQQLPQKKQLSRAAIGLLLIPYFWPDATAESAFTNRIRVVMTWVFVILSKVCNLSGPLLLGWASTALAHEQYADCIKYSIGYAVIGFLGSAFKELQSLAYLKVAQAAFVQLSETTFAHLHSLSLDWHLRKKLGEVIRSMDRGIAACNTLMSYLFLWLVPALAECLVVCVIFATYFSYLPMAVAVFYFVWFYIVWTIMLTLWRKKFRKAVVASDNEWHDRCTDSLINFETVKYFTAEDYERNRFGSSVEKFQTGSVNVQASLSFLNISQKIILQLCLATALSLAAIGIRKRIDCCLELGCDSGVSECCQAIDTVTCPGMQVGDFVAVLSYTLQLFQPLNFLGSIYNAVVMAMIDLTNLSELLAVSPDVTDAPDAMTLPSENRDEPDIAVEFDNVLFHYPTQPSSKGLKGLSFKMKRGTTTAVVGPTGKIICTGLIVSFVVARILCLYSFCSHDAHPRLFSPFLISYYYYMYVGAGKTTISRLFFRFYDVLGGAIKVNGKDVRTVTQSSLRGAIGVVPQAASMFNDTIKFNMMYGRRNASEEELVQAAQDAQILGFIESLDEGWETMVGDRGMKLSGGEQQRAAIARCLLKDPPFVCKYRIRCFVCVCSSWEYIITDAIVFCLFFATIQYWMKPQVPCKYITSIYMPCSRSCG